MNKLFSRIIPSVMTVSILAATASPALAVTDDDIYAAQAALGSYQSELQDATDDIVATKTLQNEILAQIDEYEKELVVTLASIAMLDSELAKKDKEIAQTAEDLAAAEADRDRQYEAMKERIRYIYENGGDNAWAVLLLTGDDLSGAINNIDFTQELYKYDRKELEAFRDCINLVTELQEKQNRQRASLATMKQEQVNAQKNLVSLKQKAEEQNLDYAAKIKEAQDIALEYLNAIERQNAYINNLQTQQAEETAAAEAAARAAEEAARIAAEEEAARQAAAQQAIAAAIANSNTYENTYSYAEPTQSYEDTTSYSAPEPTYNDYSGYDSGYTDTSTPVYQEPVSTPAPTNTQTSTPAASTSSSANSSLGQQIANYATQFVGNPYVWGGTSLTDGCDCSGFVQSVFGNYGINLSRTTYTQINEGTSVAYEDMQPGDVINYGYHTAIYLGDDTIVHAADSDLGIIIQHGADYQQIYDIKRYY